MEAQFNFQIRHRNDKREWENIEIHDKTHCDREKAIRYARRLSKTFKSEIRMTQGTEPLKANGSYFNEYLEPLKIKNNGKLV